MKRRFPYFRVLVLGFYLFYALAPLMYSIGDVQAEEQSGSLPGLTLASSQTSLVDQSPSPASLKQGDDSSSAAPASRVLLKKKRAVPPTFKNIIETLSLSEVKLFECLPSTLAEIATRIPDDRPVCPHGYQLCHSGISPPSA